MARHILWAVNVASDAGMAEIIPAHDLCLTHIAISHSSPNILDRTSLILTIPPRAPGTQYLKVTLGTFQVAHCEQLPVTIHLNKGINYSLQTVGLSTLSVLGYYNIEEPDLSAGVAELVAPAEISQLKPNMDFKPRATGGSSMLTFAQSPGDAPKIMVVPPVTGDAPKVVVVTPEGSSNSNQDTGPDQSALPSNVLDFSYRNGNPISSLPSGLDPDFKFGYRGPDLHERMSDTPMLPLYMPLFDKEEEPVRSLKKKKLNTGTVASGKKEKKGKDTKEKKARLTKAKGKARQVDSAEDEGTLAAGPSGNQMLYEM
ncbi:hypothetical protein EV360DRAFT_81647 [Lentinula raphanica]|nr:hypothetical protein EV360DRAFT_81647 [Lentinula raphanica]